MNKTPQDLIAEWRKLAENMRCQTHLTEDRFDRLVLMARQVQADAVDACADELEAVLAKAEEAKKSPPKSCFSCNVFDFECAFGDSARCDCLRNDHHLWRPKQ